MLSGQRFASCSFSHSIFRRASRSFSRTVGVWQRILSRNGVSQGSNSHDQASQRASIPTHDCIRFSPPFCLCSTTTSPFCIGIVLATEQKARHQQLITSMLSFRPRTTSGVDLDRVHPSRKSMVMFGSLASMEDTPPVRRELKNGTPKASSDILHTMEDPSSSVHLPWLGRGQHDNESTKGLDYTSFVDVMLSDIGSEPSPCLPSSRTRSLGNPSEGPIAPQTAEELSLSDRFDLACKFEDLLYIVQRVNSLRRSLYRLPRAEYNSSLDRAMRRPISNLKNKATQLLDNYGDTPTFRTLVARYPEVQTYVRACGPFGSPPSYGRPRRRNRGNHGIKGRRSQNMLCRNFKMTQEVHQLMRGLTVAPPQGVARLPNIKTEPET